MLLVPRRKNAGQNRRSSTLFSFLSSLLTVTNWSPLAPAEFLPRRRVVRELLQGLATEESALTTAVNDQCGGIQLGNQHATQHLDRKQLVDHSQQHLKQRGGIAVMRGAVTRGRDIARHPLRYRVIVPADGVALSIGSRMILALKGGPAGGTAFSATLLSVHH